MIIFNDATLITSVQEIIQDIRNDFSEKHLFSIMRDTSDDILTQCPFHKNGQEKKPSFGIHKKTGVCHCFACGESCTLPDLVGYIITGEKLSYQTGLEYLCAKYSAVSVDERPDLELNFARVAPQNRAKYNLQEQLNSYRVYHPYMFQRKLNKEIIEMFDVGYDNKTDCITFPVRDIYGNCLFIARRATKYKYFNYPYGVYKPLYGIYELNKYAKDSDYVVLCESIFNCLSCWVNGIPALALNGTGSIGQYKLISNLPQRKIILALDNDAAGHSGTERIVNNVKNKLFYNVQYSDKRDLNDLSSDELIALICTKRLVNFVHNT